MAAGNQPRDGQADGLPRARVYQFGPFRIGFGAGRGDLFHNLHQQIPSRQCACATSLSNLNAPYDRQIGLGFGFGRPLPIPSAAGCPQTLPQTWPTCRLSCSRWSNRLSRKWKRYVSLPTSFIWCGYYRRNYSDFTISRPIPLSHKSIAFQNPPAVSSSTSSVTTAPSSSISDAQTPAMNAGDSRLPEGLSYTAGSCLIPLHSPEQGPQSAGRTTRHPYCSCNRNSPNV